jgi:prophage regulatory protein
VKDCDATFHTVNGVELFGMGRGMSNDDELLTIEGVAKLLKVTPRYLRTMVETDRFPVPIRLGRAVRWSRAVVIAWIAEQSQTANRGGELVEHRG